MKRYAVCITDDDGGTGEAVFTVKNKTEARARGRLYIRQWQLPNGKIEYIRELAEGEEAVMMCPSRRAVPAGTPTRSRLPRCLLARWEIRSRRFMPPPS